MAAQKYPVLDPNIPIVDCHHHLWDRAGWRYLENDFLSDVSTGHKIVATVFVECRSHYLTTGPEEQRSLGETRYAADIASRHAGKLPHLCAGIVGNVDLRLGVRAEALLELHLEASTGYFRGVRQIAAFDPDPEVAATTTIHPPPGLLSDSRFREGFSRLHNFNLTFETWLYHTQLSELYDLVQAFPSTIVVLDHAAWPIGVGSYAARKAEVFAEWRKSITQLAALPNLFVKLGGLGMPVVDLRSKKFDDKPAHEILAAAWRPYLEVVISNFGVDRCMFESNFPVDRLRLSYDLVWNTLQFFSTSYSWDERRALFHDVAHSVYRLS
jgi:predicted TIM-barrel fold metal-dependent hydrolase